MLNYHCTCSINFLSMCINTCRGEIRARMTCGDMYTEYVINKFRRAKAKASGHTVSIISRNNQMFEVIIAQHGFHMDKGHRYM